MIIFGTTNDILCEDFASAMLVWDVKDRELSYFLDYKLSNLNGIFLNQSKCCSDILEKFEMKNCKKATTSQVAILM